MNKVRANGEHGVVMIIVIIVILVLMIIAFTTLMTSRTSIKLSADFRGKNTLYYKAEEGANRALARFLNEDPLKAADASEGGLNPYTGKVTCDINGNAVAVEGDNGDILSINCDFLGHFNRSVNPPTVNFDIPLVMVSRKPDHCKGGAQPTGIPAKCENNNDSTDGQVYLVNSIAKDPAGRQELVQSVIITPMLRTVQMVNGAVTPVTIIHPYKGPYMAAFKRGGEHSFPTPVPEP